MIAPLQLQAKSHGSKTTSPSAALGIGLLEHRARRLAADELDNTYERKADRTDDVSERGAAPAHGFSFSRVSVFGLQRKCACGGGSGLSGKCEECGKKHALGLQPKLTVNEPGDAYEQEADRVAQAMMGSFSHPAEPQSTPEIEPHHPAESDLTKGGERLPPDVAEFYETRFGRDFSGVRIHTGETATRYNDSVNAYAFTYGNHIWLGPGLRQQPSHILAHELAHVVQQTQPPPLASAHGQTDLSPSPQGVQRSEAYWMPAEFVAKQKSAKKIVGNPTHDYVLPKIGAFNHIFTEAPVPNANSKGEDQESTGVDFGKTGKADFYDASKTVGLFFLAHNQPQELKSDPKLKYEGNRYKHIENSAPRAVESRFGVIHAGSAPTRILVGDLKPSHGTIEAQKGPQQVQDYLGGFQFAREQVNGMSVGTGKEQTDEKWKPLETGIIHLQIPEEFKEETRGHGQPSKALIQVRNGREVDPPKPVKGKRREFPMGKVYIKESPGKGGIWNYVWEPDTPVKADELPKGVTDFGAKVQTELIDPLLVSPVKGARKARPAQRPSSLTPSPRGIQARGRDTAPAVDVTDTFDVKSWNEAHGRLTPEEKQLEKTPEFAEAEYKSFVLEDRRAASKSGFRLPSLAVSKEEETAGKTFNKIRFWTGASSLVFGRFRSLFGGAFVKVYNAYHSIRDRFRKSLDGKSAPESGGLLGTIIKIAFNILKVAGRILVERTATELVLSLKTGVERKLRSLVEDRIEEFEAKVEEIKALADNLQQQAAETLDALVEKTIGPYEKHIGTIVDAASQLSKASNVVSKVRWGARVIACLSPPGWGCLWILAESVIEQFASWLIDSCWFKKEIAPLVTSHKFIANLPIELAQIIIKNIKGFLPNDLDDVFVDVKSLAVDTHIAPHEVCDKDDGPYDRLSAVQRMLARVIEEVGEKKMGGLGQVNRAVRYQ